MINEGEQSTEIQRRPEQCPGRRRDPAAESPGDGVSIRSGQQPSLAHGALPISA